MRGENGEVQARYSIALDELDKGGITPHISSDPNAAMEESQNVQKDHQYP